MKSTIEKSMGLFSSITCLSVEGIEFMRSSEVLDAIQKEASKGYDECAKALQKSHNA